MLSKHQKISLAIFQSLQLTAVLAASVLHVTDSFNGKRSVIHFFIIQANNAKLSFRDTLVSDTNGIRGLS